MAIEKKSNFVKFKNNDNFLILHTLLKNRKTIKMIFLSFLIFPPGVFEIRSVASYRCQIGVKSGVMRICAAAISLLFEMGCANRQKGYTTWRDILTNHKCIWTQCDVNNVRIIYVQHIECVTYWLRRLNNVRHTDFHYQSLISYLLRTYWFKVENYSKLGLM